MAKTDISNSVLQFDNSKMKLEGTLIVDTVAPDYSPVSLEVHILAVSEWEDRKSEPHANQTKVYISDEISSKPLLDMFSGYRYNRPWRWYKMWLKPVLDEMYRSSGYTPYPYKLSWKQYCGCTCPCSPGFLLLADNPYNEYLKNLFTRVYITIHISEVPGLVPAELMEEAVK